MFSQRIQNWFTAQSLPVRIAIFSVIAIPILAMTFFDLSPKELLAYLPYFGGLAAVGGVGGFVFWRWREKRALENQLALNAEIAAGAVCLRVALPDRAGGEQWKKVAAQAETFTAFLATVLRQDPDQHLALEIVGSAEGTVLQVWAPESVFPTVLQGLLSAFPEAQIREPKDVLKRPDALTGLDPQTKWMVLGLAQKPCYPLRQAAEFPSDSLAFTLAAMGRQPGMGRMGVQFILKAPDNNWANAGAKEVQRSRAALDQQRAGLRSSGDKQRVAALEGKADTMTGSAATIVVFAEPQSEARLPHLVMAVTNAARSQFNGLKPIAEGSGAARVIGRHFEHSAKTTVLSAEELAPLWHVPQGGLGDLLTARGAYLPPPPEVIVTTRPPFNYQHRILGQGYMPTGENVFVRWAYGDKDRFDTLVHGFFTGSTGSGKSTLMGNEIAQDIYWGGCSTVVIEPHRNLILTIIGSVPVEREQDVIWVNPTDPERTFGLNPLDYGGNLKLRPAISAAFVLALQKIMGEEGSSNKTPRMTSILSNSVDAVLEGVPQPTILHLAAFLRYEEYRESVLVGVRNPEVKAFWGKEFPEMGSRQAEVLGPVFTRLRGLLTRMMTRQVLAQPMTTLPMRPMMDAGKIVLIDVSSSNPEVGDQNAAALGTLLVNAIWGAVKSRVKGSFILPGYLWIDEFHLFVTRDIEKMLAEARGFGLGVYLATQYYDQLPDWMRQAVLSNTWTKLVGRTNSPEEARLAARIFRGITETQIQTLPSFTYIATVAANKQTTDPFTLKTLPPLDPDKLRKAYLRANGGRLLIPEDYGAVPLDFFAEVPLPDAGDRRVWLQHQTAMRGKDLESRAEYLAGLSPDAMREYQAIRRMVDKEEYARLMHDPQLIPDVDLALSVEEMDKISATVLSRIKRIRRLSSLQVERPRDEIRADDLRLEAETAAAENVMDDLLL